MANTDVSIQPASEANNPAAFLVLDTESVPDGKLLGLVKYPGQHLSPEEAVQRAQAEARERSRDGSDFLPVTFQYPVAVCVARVGPDFQLQEITSLDTPQFRPQGIVEDFWKGLAHYSGAKLVTFNGRGFDLPLLELAAFRYGFSAKNYFKNSRNRYTGAIDLMDWFSNFGAYRLAGGLNLLSKILGKPGKMEVDGDHVYAMYQAGKSQEINAYCMFDTLDTYFVFLRSRVLTGELPLNKETELVQIAKAWIISRVPEVPALQQYLDNWGDWVPWP